MKANDNFPSLDRYFHRHFAKELYSESGLQAYDFVVDFLKKHQPALLSVCTCINSSQGAIYNNYPSKIIIQLWSAVSVTSACIEYWEKHNLPFQPLCVEAEIRRKLGMPYEVLTNSTIKAANTIPDDYDIQQDATSIPYHFGTEVFINGIKLSCDFLKDVDSIRHEALQRMSLAEPDYCFAKDNLSKSEQIELMLSLNDVCSNISGYEASLQNGDSSWLGFLRFLFKIRELKAV